MLAQTWTCLRLLEAVHSAWRRFAHNPEVAEKVSIPETDHRLDRKIAVDTASVEEQLRELPVLLY